MSDLEHSKEKCESFEKSNKSLSDEIEHLKEEDSSLKADCKTLEEKCQALQEELHEAKISGQSLREQLHEQSMTLEQVISEMKEESFEGNRNQEADRSEGEYGVDGDYLESAEKPLQSGYRTEAELKHKVSRLERVLTDKDSLIAELKEQMRALSLHQAAMVCPPTLPESTTDLEREVHGLREELEE
jgi:DNA repair exonuclease SbcCD ATPase subunit